MLDAIGSVLPLGVGIAISPIPIIAAILMLLSPQAKGTSIGFLVGWVAGIVVAVTVFILLSSVLPDTDPDASKPVAGVIQVVLGVLLLLLAVRQWRGRPKPGEQAALPKWMAAIDSMTFGRGLGLGFLLAAVNPKNLLLAASAGVAIGTAGIAVGQTVVVVTIFTVLAASTVLVPVIGFLLASSRLAEPLDALRSWLLTHNAAIMAALFLVLGAAMIGKGIGSL